MIYYYMVIFGIICLICASFYGKYQDKKQLQTQEKFNQRMADKYEDKDIEMEVPKAPIVVKKPVQKPVEKPVEKPGFSKQMIARLEKKRIQIQ